MTKTKVLSVFAIVAVAAMMGVSSLAPAYAGIGFTSPATVITDFGCFLAEEDGGGPGGSFTSEMTHFVSNKNNAILVCHFEGVENNTGKAIRHSGFECVTFAGLADSSRSVVDDEGNATLVCKVKAS